MNQTKLVHPSLNKNIHPIESETENFHYLLKFFVLGGTEGTSAGAHKSLHWCLGHIQCSALNFFGLLSLNS